MSSAASQPAKPRRKRPSAEVAFACVSQAAIAEILGVVARQVRNLEKAGLPKEAEGYPVGKCVRWYVQFKVTEARQRGQPQNSAPTTRAGAEDRKAIAEAGLLELKLEKERGNLVEIAAYESELSRVFGAMRREINMLPSELGPKVLHLTDLAEARRLVKKGRDALLRRLQLIGNSDEDWDESDGEDDE